MNDGVRYAFRQRKEFGTRYGVVRNDDLEEDGRLAAPIFPKHRRHAHHLRGQLNASDGRPKLCLLYECPGDIHDFIIAYSNRLD